MVETLHPGIYVVERFESPPAFEGVGVSTGGFIGIAKKGPIQSARVVASFEEFIRIYGGLYRGNYLPLAVDAFFKNGGTRCYIGRIMGSGNAAADVALKDLEGGNDTVTFDAANPGAWGNALSVSTLKFSATIALAVATNDTSAVFSTVDGLEVGDIIKIEDGSSNVYRTMVKGIAPATNTVTFTKYTGTGINAGSTVISGSQHLAKTTLATGVTFANGATSVQLTSTRNIRVGSVIRIAGDDGGGNEEEVTVIVTGVNGDVIQFAAVTLSNTLLAANSVVASQEFFVVVKDSGVEVERHEFLSMEDTDDVNYIEFRLAGRGNQSEYIIATDEDSATVDDAHHAPFPQADTPLTGGAEGATPTDNDYVGVQTPGAKSGIYLFDAVDDVNMISTPGVTTQVVTENGATYAENRGDLMYIASVPLAEEQVEEAKQYRQLTLNIDTSYAALYWPWLRINDPETDNRIIEVPQDGAVQGIYSAVGADRGVHKAPANERVRGVVGLSTDEQGLDYNVAQDILNPVGVNVTRPFTGQGIRVFGARTLWTNRDGRHYVNVRRVLNFIEETIAENTLFSVFEPNDEELWAKIRQSVTDFLFEVWEAGMLFPREDFARAQFVKCDSATNPLSSQLAGKVKCLVGVSIVRPAEFVVFEVSGFEGGRTVEEIG
jgi:phage tail sheath protein FI